MWRLQTAGHWLARERTLDESRKRLLHKNPDMFKKPATATAVFLDHVLIWLLLCIIELSPALVDGTADFWKCSWAHTVIFLFFSQSQTRARFKCEGLKISGTRCWFQPCPVHTEVSPDSLSRFSRVSEFFAEGWTHAHLYFWESGLDIGLFDLKSMAFCVILHNVPTFWNWGWTCMIILLGRFYSDT